MLGVVLKDSSEKGRRGPVLQTVEVSAFAHFSRHTKSESKSMSIFCNMCGIDFDFDSEKAHILRVEVEVGVDFLIFCNISN